MKVPEQYRVKKGLMASTALEGNNGAFQIPHPKIADYRINVIVSDGMGWNHVSVSLVSKLGMVNRCPTWIEMCFVKEMFFGEDEAVIQFHPPKSEYVNNHNYCLHLWQNQNQEIQLPDSIMVGVK